MASDLALAPAYVPQAWHMFFAMMGGAAATLTGLFFIAFSLRLGDLQRSIVIRTRARYLLLGTVMICLGSGFVLLPAQPLWALSVEIVSVSAAYSAYTIVTIIYAVRREPMELTVDLAARYVAMAVILLLAWASGASLVVRAGGGLYLFAIALLLALPTEVLSAWSLVIGIGKDNRPARETPPARELVDAGHR